MKSVAYDKCFTFSLEIIKLYSHLRSQNEYVISKQLLRSGTSIGANMKEAQSGQSKRDFLAKVYIALKEAGETEYWLELLNESDLTKIDILPYLASIREIIHILTSITKTTTANLKK
jgi:four helix bundle protein